MFSLDTDSTFAHLDPETRDSLVALLEDRRNYLVCQVELCRLRILAINEQTPEASQAVEDYSKEHIRPLREKMSPKVHALLMESVNVDALKSMLPMLMLGAMQSLDVSLALTASGADPDLIIELIGMIQEYFKTGM